MGKGGKRGRIEGGKSGGGEGRARFSFLSASTADKGHCGGSYCGGLTYARVYAYVEPIWMRAGAPYRSHPYISSPEESGLTHAPTVTTYLYIYIYKYTYARQSFPNLVVVKTEFLDIVVRRNILVEEQVLIGFGKYWKIYFYYSILNLIV